MSQIRQQLAQELAQVAWRDLLPHAQRDVVIVVTEGLDLLEVGVAIAQDETQPVQRWISEALIYKPSSGQLSAWNQQPSQTFNVLIVQPFVLIRPTPDPAIV